MASGEKYGSKTNTDISDIVRLHELGVFMTESEREKLVQPIGGEKYLKVQGDNCHHLLALKAFNYSDEAWDFYCVRFRLVSTTHSYNSFHRGRSTYNEKSHFENYPNAFQANFNKINQSFFLGPGGHIMVGDTKLRGLGIGPHCMSLVIQFALEHYSDYSFTPGRLSRWDATPDNLERRSQFYRGFNFKVTIDENGEGNFSSDCTASLKTNFDTSKIVTLSNDDILKELVDTKNSNVEKEQHIERLSSVIERLKKQWFSPKQRYYVDTGKIIFYWSALLAFALFSIFKNFAV